MKCKNCGANLDHNYCEYCGTFYGEELRKITINTRQIFDNYGVRDVNGRLKPVYPHEVIEVTCIGDTERHFIEV